MRCKMWLTDVKISANTPDGKPVSRLRFLPVISGDSPENKEVFRHLPSGEIRLDAVNESIVTRLSLGAEYYVDFTKA